MTIMEALRQVTSSIKTWVTSNANTHNTNTDAHNDIRLELQLLANKLNAFLDSDDATLDELSELITAINNNKTTVEQLTSGKVNVIDIVNNLTTNASNKPLSAAQGVALKALVDAITVPTKVSQLENDSNYLNNTFASAVVIPHTGNTDVHITAAERTAWNAKSNFSGKYSDLSGQPTIPTVPTKISAFTNDKGYLTSYTETDPTVPSWAKASSKPSYTKSEVGLENVDNIKQYSANNPPPYPVTAVNSRTGNVTIRELPTVTTADNGKVLMVVNGAWAVVDLNMSVDTNGILYV